MTKEDIRKQVTNLYYECESRGWTNLAKALSNAENGIDEALKFDRIECGEINEWEKQDYDQRYYSRTSNDVYHCQSNIHHAAIRINQGAKPQSSKE